MRAGPGQWTCGRGPSSCARLLGKALRFANAYRCIPVYPEASPYALGSGEVVRFEGRYQPSKCEKNGEGGNILTRKVIAYIFMLSEVSLKNSLFLYLFSANECVFNCKVIQFN